MAKATPRISSSDLSVEDVAARLNSLLRQKHEPAQAAQQQPPLELGIHFGLHRPPIMPMRRSARATFVAS